MVKVSSDLKNPELIHRPHSQRSSTANRRCRNMGAAAPVRAADAASRRRKRRAAYIHRGAALGRHGPEHLCPDPAARCAVGNGRGRGGSRRRAVSDECLGLPDRARAPACRRGDGVALCERSLGHRAGGWWRSHGARRPAGAGAVRPVLRALRDAVQRGGACGRSLTTRVVSRHLRAGTGDHRAWPDGGRPHEGLDTRPCER